MWSKMSDRKRWLFFTCVITILHNPGPIECGDKFHDIRSGPAISAVLETELEDISLDQYIVAEAKKRLMRKPDDIYLVNVDVDTFFIAFEQNSPRIDATIDKKLRTDDFLHQSYNLAAGLQTLGCNKDTIVGIISENGFEFPVVILATWLTGATVTTLTPSATVEEFRPLFNITQPRLVFCRTDHCEKIMQVADNSRTVIIVLDWKSSSKSAISRGIPFERLLHSVKQRVEVKNSPDDVACVLYSSGTTGLSKGVMLTHRNIAFVLKLLQANLIENNGAMSMCLTMMYHVSGFLTTLGALVRHETLVIFQKRYSDGSFLSAIQTYNVKRLLLTPGIITFLLTNPEVNNFDLSSLEFVSCGAAPITPDTEDALKKKFGLRYVQQVYGMTETTMYTMVRHPLSPKKGSCGTPVPGVQIKVVDLANGGNESLGSNRVGEICVRGPSVAKGYFNNDGATANTIDGDGWLHSGDVGYYDDDGDFFIVDRIKELLKVDGLQVAPAELEGILLEHPGVVECVVVGIPDKRVGALPKAFVVKDDGVEVRKDDLIELVAKRVLPQKRLTGGVEFVTELPRNSTGKIMRRQVLDEWLEKHRS